MNHNSNTLKKAMKVRTLVELHYEPGRQDRNRRWVFRNVVVKTYPMSERTFWRYMSLTRDQQMQDDELFDTNQLKLF